MSDKALRDSVKVLLKQNEEMAKQNKRLLQKLEAAKSEKAVRQPVRRSPRKKSASKNTPSKSPPRAKITPSKSPPRAKNTPRKHVPPVKNTPPPAVAAGAPRKTPPFKKRTKEPQKRTPTAPNKRLVRKALGYAIRQNLDSKILGQWYRDEHRFFRVEEFKHDTKPLIIALETDEEIPTDDFSREDLYKLAIDIAKKRDRYVPVEKKQDKTPNTKVDMALIRRRGAAAAAAAAASTNDDAAAAASTNDDDVPDDDDAPNDDVHDASDGSDDSDGRDVLDYMAMNKEAQDDREKQKEWIAKKKKEVAENRRKAIIAMHTKGEAKKAVDRSKKRSSKRKTKATAPLPKPKAKKKSSPKSTKKPSKTETECQLSLGLRVLGYWPDDKGVCGEWFEGKVIGIDYEEQTVHIEYDDGDIDDAVPWSKCRILGDECKTG